MDNCKKIMDRTILKKVKESLELSFVLAKAEFKLRNEGSYLGILWYLLNPILLFGILYLIFNDRLGQKIANYPLYLLAGVIMFNFFQATTVEATKSIIQEHKGIIKSINFPKESLILAIVFKNLFSHFFEILLFILLMIYFKVSISGIILYPIILIFFSLFVFGISSILSSLTVYFVDMENIWNFVVRILWLATPIFYAIEGQTRLFYLNLFNPMYYFMTVFRNTVIYFNLTGYSAILGAIFYSLAFFIVGLLVFRRLKNKFAEKI